MKIFNWMNRKLRPTTCQYSSLEVYTKDALNEDTEKRRSAEKDTEALLLHHVLEGFLTIGTFGHGHPVILPSIQEEEEQEPKEEETSLALTPALVTSGAAAPTATFMPNIVETPALVTSGAAAPAATFMPNINIVETLALMMSGAAAPTANFMPNIVETVAGVEEMAFVEEPMRPSCEIKPLLEERAEKGRTTLADLFAADAADHARVPSGKKMPREVASGGMMRALRHGKRGKKHMHEGGGSPAPPPTAAAITQKLHRLMARMLKKRIHPNVAHTRRVYDEDEDEEDIATNTGATAKHGCLLP